MKARLVYLAGPIYDCDDTCVEWRKTAARILRSKKIMSCMGVTQAGRGCNEARQSLDTVSCRQGV